MKELKPTHREIKDYRRVDPDYVSRIKGPANIRASESLRIIDRVSRQRVLEKLTARGALIGR